MVVALVCLLLMVFLEMKAVGAKRPGDILATSPQQGIFLSLEPWCTCKGGVDLLVPVGVEAALE